VWTHTRTHMCFLQETSPPPLCLSKTSRHRCPSDCAPQALFSHLPQRRQPVHWDSWFPCVSPTGRDTSRKDLWLYVSSSEG
jgi:hypothetical protein